LLLLSSSKFKLKSISKLLIFAFLSISLISLSGFVFKSVAFTSEPISEVSDLFLFSLSVFSLFSIVEKYCIINLKPYAAFVYISEGPYLRYFVIFDITSLPSDLFFYFFNQTNSSFSRLFIICCKLSTKLSSKSLEKVSYLEKIKFKCSEKIKSKCLEETKSDLELEAFKTFSNSPVLTF